MPGRTLTGRARATRRRQNQPAPLKPSHELFALEYLSNGENATAAYLAVHPKAKATTAAPAGYKAIRKHQIAAFIDRERQARFKRLQMNGDEALARVARHAAVDVRMLYDDKGELLPPHQWPEEIAGSVKAVKAGPYGLSITLVDPLTAQRIILEQTDKLKSSAGPAVDALVKAIRGDLGLSDEDEDE